MRYIKLVSLALLVGGAACGSSEESPPAAENRATNVAQIVVRTDIVSDRAGATAMDPRLINAWGLAFNPIGAAWVSAQGTGFSEVYDATGKQLIPSVAIPACRAPASSPTGQVFNDTQGAFMGDNFVFVTEQGTVAGWQPSLDSRAALRAGAEQCVSADPNAAVYKGVTIAKDATGRPRLYAANFRGGTVDVFDASYARMNMAGKFVDPGVPAGFAPFNVQEVDGRVVVTYAKQDAARGHDVAGAGNGFVDLYDVDGNFLARMVSAGELNSPWGVVKAPNNFGALSNHLLVGNFGDGLIHSYALDANMGLARVTPAGPLGGPNGQPMVIDGLWALRFGLNAGGFRPDVLYFTAGPEHEAHGIFGRLEVQPAQGQAPGQMPGGPY